MACVGEHADDSEYILEYLRQLNSELEYIGVQRDDDCDLCGKLWEYGLWLRLHFRPEWLDESMVDRVHSTHHWLLSSDRGKWRRVVSAIDHFEQRPNWMWLWIAPEILMSLHIHILCGRDRQNAYGLRTLLFVRTLVDNDNTYEHHADRSALERFRTTCNWRIRIGRVNQIFLSTFGSSSPSSRMEQIHRLECPNLSDTYYALIDVTKWYSHHGPPTLDYRKSALALCVDIAPHFDA